MEIFKTIDKETAYNLAKMSKMLYSKFILNNNDSFTKKLKRDYPLRNFVKMVLLTNVLFSMDEEKIKTMPTYSIADNSLTIMNLNDNIEEQAHKFFDNFLMFQDIKGIDIRNSLFHGKFALGWSHDLNEPVLILRPNTSKINQKEKITKKTYFDKMEEIHQTRVFEEVGSNKIPTYNMVISESNLLNFILQNFEFDFNENGKGNDLKDVFALVSLCLYSEHGDVDYQLSEKERNCISSFAISIYQLSIFMPLCLYCQDELDTLRKKYKADNKTEPQELTNLFAIRDLIAHGNISQIYTNNEYKIKFSDVYKGDNIELVLDENYGEKILSNFLDLFNEVNKIQE